MASLVRSATDKSSSKTWNVINLRYIAISAFSDSSVNVVSLPRLEFEPLTSGQPQFNEPSTRL